jgi:hypothetical protein
MNRTDYLDGEVLKAAFRTQVWAQRANTTAYALGDRVYAAAFDGNIYECVTAGTTAGSPPTFNTNLGDTTADGTVTWLTLKLGMPKRPMYVGLFTVPPSDAGGGTEVTGGSYARQAYQPTDANWQSPSTVGNTYNKLLIQFPAPTGNWGDVSYFGIFDRLSGGNLLWYGALTDAIAVANGDPAPSFAAGALQVLDKQQRAPGLRTTVP